jgi:acetyl-CoA acyltransferase 1
MLDFSFSHPFVPTDLIGQISRYVYCLQQLDLDIAKVNVNGGAIALGHPLGATGVRQVVTGLAELGRRGERVLVSSMCIGSG